MTQENIAKMNNFSQNKTPFIAVLSYDEPENDIVCKLSEAKNFGVKFKFNAKKKRKISYKMKKFSLKFKAYKTTFNNVQKYMRLGHCYLANLCFATPFHTNLSPKTIYKHSAAPLKIMLKNRFICFTPELFVKIKNRKISTYPMKGTIDAKIPMAREILLNDKKELSEQAMITDLMRNDLNMVSSAVQVEKFRYFSKIKTKQGEILQTSTKISGRLSEHFSQNFGDLFEKILPAGSITGAPKMRVCEILREVECEKRGFYTGVFVHFDGLVLRSFVLIRFVEISPSGLKFFSGGGITLESTARKEFDELIKKAYFTF